MKCSVCGEGFPVASVSYLHCYDYKEWDDADDGLWLLVEDDWVKIPV